MKSFLLTQSLRTDYQISYQFVTGVLLTTFLLKISRQHTERNFINGWMNDSFLLIGLVKQVFFFYVDVVIPVIFVVCPSLIFLFFVLNVRTCAQVAK